MATKYQIKVKMSEPSQLIPRSSLYRTLGDAQAAAEADANVASLILITGFTSGMASEHWYCEPANGQWHEGQPASLTAH